MEAAYPIRTTSETRPDSDSAVKETEQQRTAVDRIVTSIHDFVTFLQKLYVPEDAILVPPTDGWPTITKGSWSSFGKSNEVIEVLRRLTYIKPHFTGEAYEFLPSSGLFDFQNPRSALRYIAKGEGKKLVSMTEVPGEPCPSHVVGLVGGGRHSHPLLLDCREGLIYGEGSLEGGWREGIKRPVEDYFAMLKDDFRSMRILPRKNHQVSLEGEETPTIFEALKEMFKRHGWPDNYQRDDCVAELEQFGKPDNLCRLQDEYFASLKREKSS